MVCFETLPFKTFVTGYKKYTITYSDRVYPGP